MLLQDSIGGIWDVEIDDAGELNINPSVGFPTTWFLNDARGGSWQIVVSPAGILGTLSAVAGIYPIGSIFTGPRTSTKYVVSVDLAGEIGSDPFSVWALGKIPIPFTARTTAAVAVFACLGMASPGATQRFPGLFAAIQLAYGLLFSSYRQLIHQDTAANQIDLGNAIAIALFAARSLSMTLNSYSAVGDAAFILARMQNVAANAVVNIQKAQIDDFIDSIEGSF